MTDAPPPPPGYPAPPPATPPGKGLALASLLCGIGGLLTCGLTALVGVILGILALVKIAKGAATGKGLAVAGLVVSGLVVIVAPILAMSAAFLFTWRAADRPMPLEPAPSIEPHEFEPPPEPIRPSDIEIDMPENVPPAVQQRIREELRRLQEEAERIEVPPPPEPAIPATPEMPPRPDVPVPVPPAPPEPSVPNE
jgi:hypothetical protein